MTSKDLSAAQVEELKKWLQERIGGINLAISEFEKEDPCFEFFDGEIKALEDVKVKLAEMEGKEGGRKK